MLNEFRQFILRGNLVDLAVAVVIGTAFAAVVASLVEDLITPLIAAIVGKSDFSALSFEINGSTFRYGDFINALITFLLVAAVLFFVVIKPVNALLARVRSEARLTRRPASARSASARFPTRRAAALSAPSSWRRPEPYAPEPCALPSV